MSTSATELQRRISKAFPGVGAVPSDRKRILLSAFAMSPCRGSEPAVGWNVAMRLAAVHDVTVLTSTEGEGEGYREETLRHLEANPVPGLTIAACVRGGALPTSARLQVAPAAIITTLLKPAGTFV